MTQAKLAKDAVLSRTSIAQIERGRQDVTLETFARIAQALKTQPHILLKQAYAESPKPKPHSWASEVLDA